MGSLHVCSPSSDPVGPKPTQLGPISMNLRYGFDVSYRGCVLLCPFQLRPNKFKNSLSWQTGRLVNWNKIPSVKPLVSPHPKF